MITNKISLQQNFYDSFPIEDKFKVHSMKKKKMHFQEVKA